MSAANIAVMLALINRRVGRLRRPARLCLGLALALGSATLANDANAQTVAPSTNQTETLDAFYAARGNRPLWLAGKGDEPSILIDWLRSAEIDRLDPSAYHLRDLDRALRQARSGNLEAVLRADRLLSQAYIDYVRDLRRPNRTEMIWVDPELRPSATFPRRSLDAAATASSLRSYLIDMRWMNPIYAGLRRAIAEGAAQSREQRDLLALNLERARVLPAGEGRSVIVNASAATLTMYDGGAMVDSMRVVVGKPVNPTPVMAALIRFASLNPYWNVPPDLAAERIAPNVVKDGKPYLKAKGYQVLANWDADATPISPDAIDWPAVAAGRQEVRIRQLPGPSNSMGKMKFMFPNAQGVYLHDTPEKNLLGEETRMFSGGCVRLEDAPRLARWLFDGNPPATKSATPEQRVDLPTPVPVFLTYLTAVPGEHGGVVYLPDVYDRDKLALAALEPERKVASR